MKKVLVAVCLLMTVNLTAQTTLVVACQQDLEKYYPLVRAVYSRMGLACTFLVLPAERALVSVNAGTVDAEIGRTLNLKATYLSLVYTSEPILHTGLAGWKLASTDVKVTSSSDLKNYRVGIVIGQKSAEKMVGDLQLKVTKVATIEGLAQMLAAKRIDLAVVPEAVDTSVLDAVGTLIDIGIPRFPVFHILAYKHRDLAPVWDAALRSMKADGSYRLMLPSG